MTSLFPQIVIPDADTTYWCAGFQLPLEIQSSTKHMIRVRISGIQTVASAWLAIAQQLKFYCIIMNS